MNFSISGLRPDQELEEPEKISAAQNLFLDCFLYTSAQSRGKKNVSRTFAKLVEFLTSIRMNMNERQKRVKNFTEEESFHGIKVPVLVGEVLNFPRFLIDDLNHDLESLNLDLEYEQ